MKNAINWFEIPVTDFERAKVFYENLLDGPIQEMPTPNPESRYGMLPADMQNGGIGGGLVLEKAYVPSQHGPLVYLNGGEDLNVPLAKVEASGGQILTPKTSLGPNGFMAIFLDTEGNRMALHSMK